MQGTPELEPLRTRIYIDGYNFYYGSPQVAGSAAPLRKTHPAIRASQGWRWPYPAIDPSYLPLDQVLHRENHRIRCPSSRLCIVSGALSHRVAQAA